MTTNNKITNKKINFTEWYLDVISNANLIQYGPVKGTIFFTPYGYKIWTNIQNILNNEFEKLNIENMSAPLLIPMSLIEAEKNHIEGFLPETAIRKDMK